MGNFLGEFVLPLLLLTAALLNWSLISLVDMLLFLLIQFSAPKTGFHLWRQSWVPWFIVFFSVMAILPQLIFYITWAIEGDDWSEIDSWWAKLLGFVRVQSSRSPSVIYFLVVQLLTAVVALVEIYGNRLFLIPRQDSFWVRFLSSMERLGSHLKVASCLLLPAIQLIVGISRPSWASLPFFICSCIGLITWSLTSNFLGLFRWWRPLLLYTGFNIVLLYVYQLPIVFPKTFQTAADFIGFYKISSISEWTEICSGLSLLIFYYMLSFAKCDLEEMDVLMSMRENNLTEALLPSRHSFFICESRSGVRHTNLLLRGAVFRTFSINFFTYGFPVSLLALSFWSFHFASLCAFGLLVYVGYILYAFPSLFRLHRLHGLVLVFILLWAASTYIFNVAFAYLNKKLRKDTEMWETIGLWHYPIPGFYLLAQFSLGILVALGNLVNNSVFLYLSDAEGQSLNDDRTVEEMEETKVLIVATIAWGLRRSSRAITLALILLLAMKPGFIHAIYMAFFLVYLLNHTVSRKLRQSLILLCEVHFALLYILQLHLISNALEQKGSFTMEVLSQLGLMDHVTFWDFFEIAVLASFCAVQNHGFDVLFSFSAIVQHTPCPPFGFSILSAGLNKSLKSVLVSVCSSSFAGECHSNYPSYERRIATYLSRMGQKFQSVYRSCGTYIAFLTILIAVYLVEPNYISFGYLFFLVFWIIGRQLVEKTRKRLWFPLKVYSLIVFIFIYSLSIFSSFETWLSGMINLYPDMGYNPEASLLENIWESLAVLVVMQLYSYERRQSVYNRVDDAHQLEHGALSFFRRLLIWHGDKILYLSLFYASLSPISAFGFLYLLGLIICSTLRKDSRVPSKLFLVYAGLLVLVEYLFQMWGKLAEMFPGQRHFSLSFFIGFQLFKPGFWGLESGLRGEVLVIVACALQYNVFHWLEKMPSAFVNTGKGEEPCPLFVSKEDKPTCISVHSEESKPSSRTGFLPMKQRATTSKSWPSFSSVMHQRSAPVSFKTEPQGSSLGKYSFECTWGSSRESYKWNKKRILFLRKERFDMQKVTLQIYLKFWIENLFNLFGLEINMIALLLASFAVLNAISILYIASLAACVLLDRRIIRKLWPMFVLSFAAILTLEYFAVWKNLVSSNGHVPNEEKIRCHDCCSSSSSVYFNYCKDCWLGIVVDDPQMLVSYYGVFMLACFKLRSDHLSGFSGSQTYHQMVSQRSNASLWSDLSFETKSLWTFLDYLRLYCYCHLLDLVLALILVTGTLQYDILHLGYLGFALFFFRLRLEILKKRNKIFKFLRMYNFSLIVLSLAYQSPFLGDFSAGKCETVDYIYEVIGFYKCGYVFQITSRSALVEIVIFMLVALQSYMFSSQEFDYVSRYLEAEQIGALVREQEKKAAWKTAQLQHIRKCEEQKRQRNLQVEKMKSEMLNLQIQLQNMNSTNYDNSHPVNEGLRRRKTSSLSSNRGSATPDNEESIVKKQDLHTSTDSLFHFEMHDSPRSVKSESLLVSEFTQNSMDSPPCEIIELEEKGASSAFFELGGRENGKGQAKDNPLKSAVQLIGDGVSQVQSLGNQAVTNLVSFLNIEDSDSNDHYSSAEDSLYDEIESQSVRHEHLVRTISMQSGSEKTTTEAASLQIGRIFRYIWSQIRSNNDLVCYCCFIVVFLWNFSILSMVYLAALFLYALCISTDPSYIFWVIMLIYTEFYILLQYLYQIIIQHCGLTIQWDLLQELGFPSEKIKSSFVVSTWPLFLVYLFTLLQSSITAKDGEWVSVTELESFKKRILYQGEFLLISGWKGRVQQLLLPVKNVTRMIIRSFCRYWKSLTQGAESPPYFVQLSMEVKPWPEDGIQPEKVESCINKLLKDVHSERCQETNPDIRHSASRVRVQSIERSQENPDVALAVFEVVYASPLTECHPKEWYKSLTPASDVAKEIDAANRRGFVEGIGFPYPIVSVIGGGKREIDLYAYIFGADLTVFFLVAIFYHSVIKNNSQFLEVYQLDDQFPKEFVFILMILFFLIVLDRIIYLCSFATGKVIFYLFNLVLFTYSVTEYAWYMEPLHRRAGGLALRAIYLTKAVSLALQAIQIRYGIAHKSTLYQQFLTSKVSQVYYLGFRLYRALPFLYELRCVLDWSCTTTSLTMYDWLKLEDIHSSLYLVKCDVDLNRARHQQGQKQTKMTKFCSGICLFFILICVIWAPMLVRTLKLNIFQM